MKLDLHVHTTASDGQYAPREMIHMAKEKELSYIAITDHDTVEGIAEARLCAKEEGVNYKQPEAIKQYLEDISTDMNAAAIKTARKK